MRFSRSTKDVFSFEESSESRSVSSNRHAVADQRSSLDLDDAIVPTGLDHLAVQTRWPKDATDNFLVEVESVRGDQRDTFKIHSAGYVLEEGERVSVASSSYDGRRPKPRPDVNRGEDPDRMFLVADDRANLVRLKLRDCESSAILRSLNRRQEWAAFSSQRATVFQAICFTRAIADLFRPSTLRVATSSKVARRCWSRWYGVPVFEQNVFPQVRHLYRRRFPDLVL